MGVASQVRQLHTSHRTFKGPAFKHNHSQRRSNHTSQISTLDILRGFGTPVAPTSDAPSLRKTVSFTFDRSHYEPVVKTALTCKNHNPELTYGTYPVSMEKSIDKSLLDQIANDMSFTDRHQQLSIIIDSLRTAYFDLRLRSLNAQITRNGENDPAVSSCKFVIDDAAYRIHKDRYEEVAQAIANDSIPETPVKDAEGEIEAAKFGIVYIKCVHSPTLLFGDLLTPPPQTRRRRPHRHPRYISLPPPSSPQTYPNNHSQRRRPGHEHGRRN